MAGIVNPEPCVDAFTSFNAFPMVRHSRYYMSEPSAHQFVENYKKRRVNTQAKMGENTIIAYEDNHIHVIHSCRKNCNHKWHWQFFKLSSVDKNRKDFVRNIILYVLKKRVLYIGLNGGEKEMNEKEVIDAPKVVIEDNQENDIVPFPGWFNFLVPILERSIGVNLANISALPEFDKEYIFYKKRKTLSERVGVEWYTLKDYERRELYKGALQYVNTEWKKKTFIEKCHSFLNDKEIRNAVRYHTVEHSREILLAIILHQFNNKPDFYSFLNDIHRWITKESDKRNTLAFVSNPSHGKNYFWDCFCSLIGGIEFIGVIAKNVNRHNQFPFNNCPNKILLIHNEPTIDLGMVDIMKDIYGGDPTKVNVKQLDLQEIERTPVLIMSNPSAFMNYLQNNEAFKHRIQFVPWPYIPFIKKCGPLGKPHPTAMAKIFVDFMDELTFQNDIGTLFEEATKCLKKVNTMYPWQEGPITPNLAPIFTMNKRLKTSDAPAQPTIEMQQGLQERMGDLGQCETIAIAPEVVEPQASTSSSEPQPSTSYAAEQEPDAEPNKYTVKNLTLQEMIEDVNWDEFFN